METMLFVAMSAALLVYTIMVMNGRITEVRYFDGVAQVETFLQKQLSEVASGVRLSDASPCGAAIGASNCVTLGRLISIEATDPITLKVEEVLGLDSDVDSTLGELATLSAFTPRVQATTAATHTEAAGVQLSHAAFRTPSGNDRQAIFILRSPKTGSIQHYAYTTKPTDVTPALLVGGNARLNETVNLCLKDESSPRTSFISIGAFPGVNPAVNDAGYFSLTRDATQAPAQGGC